MIDVKRLWKQLKRYPNVVGVDAELRPKIIGGVEHPETLSIRVYVSKKLPREAFKCNANAVVRARRALTGKPLLESDLIPRVIDGIPTDVVEIGELKALYDDPKKRYRPVVAGVSATHANSTACTVSGFFKTADGRVLMALNNHCGALENKARIGDPWLQPSPYDGGQLNDTVARLHSFVEIKFNEFKCPLRNFFHRLYRFVARVEPTNRVDISFGELVVDFRNTALNIGDIKSWREPRVGEKAQKCGRTTGYTTGVIISTSFIGQVQYSRGTATFEDCILVEGRGFSAGGDSGSPVFDMQGNLVGILFAGSETTTVLCKIGNVLREGNVTFIGGG